MIKTYFVTSDIHSFMDPFFTKLISSGFDNYNPDHILIVCGDAFDRGKDAVRLYKYMKELHSKDRLIYIRGNHEDLLFECVEQLKENDGCAQSYHYSNGTVDTVVQFMQEDLLDEVLEFIDKVSIDYFEIEDYIFVHGWIPCLSTNKDYYNNYTTLNRNPDWRNASKEDWEYARWVNGMKAWKDGVREDGKTIVCGHWHTGWGHYIIHHQGSSQYDNFDIFEDLGIIALDACAGYSNKINILKIEK